MKAKIYREALEDIITKEVKNWINDKIERSKLDVNAMIMSAQFKFEPDGMFVKWTCPIVLHGKTDNADAGISIWRFADTVVTGTIIGGVVIYGCRFLDRDGEFFGAYNDDCEIGRFQELFNECAI